MMQAVNCDLETKFGVQMRSEQLDRIENRVKWLPCDIQMSRLRACDGVSATQNQVGREQLIC